MLEKTPYYFDFVLYYERARALNLRNIGQLPRDTICGDELQDNVTIYDTVWRRYAGFSKVLEQLYYGPESWTQRKSKIAYRDKLDLYEWLYVCLVHRLTGSGASFEDDHGYRNTAVIEMVETREGMTQYRAFLGAYDKPMFTSIGNQIPPFNKPTKWGYDKGGREFLCEHAADLSFYIADLLTDYHEGLYGIQTMVDFVLDWMTNHGFKRYKFVLTCWVMDMAEYYPEHVDRDSHCYMGKNAYRSLDLMYNHPGISKKEFYDIAMDDLCKTLDNAPFNMEDVLCDVVRYWQNYIPKNYENYYEGNLRTVEKIK